MSDPAAARRLAWLSLYATAMGLLEAIVVVYLRELYYPGGFRFPIVIIPDRMAAIEIAREAATLLMLLAVAILAGRDRHDRFFVFALLFGVWDIVYYGGLLVLLGWPESLLTWDLLFLIPLPWIGPVVAPLAVSVVLIGGFVTHESLRRRGLELRLGRREWGAACCGALIVIVALCWNWRAVAEQTIPASFPYAIFCLGLAVGIAPFVRAALRADRAPRAEVSN